MSIIVGGLAKVLGRVIHADDAHYNGGRAAVAAEVAVSTNDDVV